MADNFIKNNYESEDFFMTKITLLELRSSDHSYSSYEPYCNIWGHDYKVTY